MRKYESEMVERGMGVDLTSWSLMAFSCSSFLAQYRASSSGMSAGKNTVNKFVCSTHETLTLAVSSFRFPEVMNELLNSGRRISVVLAAVEVKIWAPRESEELDKCRIKHQARGMRLGWKAEPSGSSKRVSSSSRWKVGSLVPQISFSAMIALESRVSHWPGPSCRREGEEQRNDAGARLMGFYWISLGILGYTTVHYAIKSVMWYFLTP